jgi:sec-independent protein translocase protein TatA
MFGIGPMEMMIVGLIALLLFGKRLPEVARSLGKGIVEFKKGMHGIEDELHEAVHRPATSQSRPIPPDERDDTSVPKFEPPRVEPS